MTGGLNVSCHCIDPPAHFAGSTYIAHRPRRAVWREVALEGSWVAVLSLAENISTVACGRAMRCIVWRLVPWNVQECASARAQRRNLCIIVPAAQFCACATMQLARAIMDKSNRRKGIAHRWGVASNHSFRANLARSGMREVFRCCTVPCRGTTIARSTSSETSSKVQQVSPPECLQGGHKAPWSKAPLRFQLPAAGSHDGCCIAVAPAVYGGSNIPVPVPAGWKCCPIILAFIGCDPMLS